jgi:hypothetical protein
MRTRSGHEFKEEFIGRVIVDYPSSPSPRVKHFNVWIVSYPLSCSTVRRMSWRWSVQDEEEEAERVEWKLTFVANAGYTRIRPGYAECLSGPTVD